MSSSIDNIVIALWYIFTATFVSLTPIIMCELVGLEKLTNGYGLLCLVRGITSIIGPPLEGKWGDNYHIL